MGPARRLLRLQRALLLLGLSQGADTRGNQAAAGRDQNQWDLKGAGGVRWDSGGAREARKWEPFSWRNLGTADR
jgi:hypothetical protein